MYSSTPPPYPSTSSFASSIPRSQNRHTYLPPAYAAAPHPLEQTLCSTTRRATSRSSIAADIPTGTSIHKLSKHLTLVLENQREEESDQEEGINSSAARVPRIGATREVKGSVLLDDDEKVGKVDIKIKGTLSLILDTKQKTLDLVSIKRELYNRSSPSHSPASSSSCPPVLPFAIPFPSTYIGSRHPWSPPRDSTSDPPGTDSSLCSYDLPPSLNVHLRSDSCSVYAAKAEYSIVVTVWYGYDLKVPLLAPGKGVQLGWKKSSHLIINYVPRAQPRHEIIQEPFPLTRSVKVQPEGWRQLSSVISSADDSSCGLTADLFLPSSLVFSFTDTIPVHLHISGPFRLLKLLTRIPLSPPGSTTNSDAGSVLSDSSQDYESPAPISISIVRQFVVQVPESSSSAPERGLKNVVIGRSRMRRLPPSFSDPSLTPGGTPMSTGGGDYDEQIGWLDWEGEVRCNAVTARSTASGKTIGERDVGYGGFKGEYLSAKDFIMFSYTPPSTSSPKNSPLPLHEPSLAPLKFYQAIRLVTDSVPAAQDQANLV